jgi:predicted O-methyltransferase YrrM
LFQRPPGSASGAVDPAAEIAAPQPAEVSSEQIASWYAGGRFSCDWTSPNFPQWMETLRPLRPRPLNVLEIGSWEGRSALFFLNYLPLARLVCIDPFTGNAIHRRDPALQEHLAQLQAIFDSNVAAFADRVEKIAAPSATALPRLAVDARQFDLAYIDGCHLATDVYSDAAMLWPMIVPGGIVIFDDYELAIDPNLQDRPKVGIDRFLALFGGQYQILHKGFQVIVAKLPSARPAA